FKTADSDFLTSDNTDFHPTDVIEDADGSLIVIDTGGWYKICCPTSQLSKPDVLGAVYRIRRVGMPAVNDPRGSKLAWDKMKPANLAALMTDSRPTVRKRAMAALANAGSEAVPALATQAHTSTQERVRRDSIWSLTRIDSPGARTAVRAALD